LVWRSFNRTTELAYDGSSPPNYGSFTTRVAPIPDMNALSSAGDKVTATILQAGIG
jgi:hypothetical protein